MSFRSGDRDMAAKFAATFLLILVVFVENTLGQNYTFVNTPNGRIRGTVRGRNVSEELPNQQTVTFLGIPYAKPPVGNLRFKKTELPDPWEGTLDGDTLPPACHQHSQYPFPWYDSEPGQSEDCLYLNVFAPYPFDRKRPVKLYIHGGGFSSGSNRMGYYTSGEDSLDFIEYNDESLKHYAGFLGFVEVTINYRLGALGFLTTGTEDAPGNVGLYDMVMAMNWVKDNIEYFGGEPNNVTLVGQGAGAIAASLFCVSPLTKGLFKQVLLTGGNFLSIGKNKFFENLQLSQRLATAVGCDTQLLLKPKEFVNCLRDVEASRLAQVLSSFYPTFHYTFYPQYERDDLLPSDPAQELRCGRVHDVNLFIGYTSNEGSYILTTTYPEVFGVFGGKDVGVNGTFAKSMLTEFFKDYPDPGAIADRLLVGSDKGATKDNRRRVYNAMGDERVVCPTVYFAEGYAKANSLIYLFEEAIAPPYNPWADWMGSVHFNNVQYQFFHEYHPLIVNGRSYEFNENERSFDFNLRIEYGFYFYGQNLQRVKFSNESRMYSFLNQTEGKPNFPVHTRSNPGGRNCEILRPYHVF